MTGKEAILTETGETFETVADARATALKEVTHG